MSRNNLLFLFAVMVALSILLWPEAHATGIWSRYGSFNGPIVFETVSAGDCFWASTLGGLIRMHPSTGEYALWHRGECGLPLSIWGVAVDSMGRLWMSGPHGLGWFDGIRFHLAFPMEVGGHSFFRLTADPNGQIWVSDGGGFIGRVYDSGVVWLTERIPVEPQQWIPVSGFAVDAEGHIWVSLLGFLNMGQVHCFDGDSWHTYDLPGYSSAIEIGPDGAAWFGGASLCSFDGATWEYYPEVQDARDSRRGTDGNLVFYTDWNGRVAWKVTGSGIERIDMPWLTSWPDVESMCLVQDYLCVATSGGCYIFDGMEWEYAGILEAPAHRVEAIASDWAGRTYVAGSGGVSELESGLFTYFDDVSERLGFRVLACKLSPQGALWVCAYAGAASFKGGEWTMYDGSEGDSPLPEAMPYDLSFGDDGSVWFATHFEGVWVLSGSEWHNYNHTNSALPDCPILLCEAAPDGTIWFHCENGEIVTYSHGNWDVVPDFSHPFVLDIAFDKLGGTVWLATSSGVKALEDGVWLDYPQLGNTTDIEVGPQGSVWAGTREYGLLRFDGQDWSTYFVDYEDDVGTVCAMTSLACDDYGRLFFGTLYDLWIVDEQIHPEEVQVVITFDRPVYSKNDTPSFALRGANFSDLAVNVDLYLACATPGGIFLFLPELSTANLAFVQDLTLHPTMTLESGPVPLITLPDLPAGTYRWFAACTYTGTTDFASNIACCEWEFE